MKINSTKLGPFIIAITFLTRLPLGFFIPKKLNIWTAENQSYSLLYYPLVGLLLSLVVAFIAYLLPTHFSPLLSATFVVACWVALTGALHLDGLADSVDAACAAHGQLNAKQKEKILEVFKDPHVGAMAVVVLVFVLLLKIAMVAQLLPSLLLALVLSMTLARTLVIALFLTTPYLRKAGLGAMISQAMPAKALWCCLLLLLGILPLLFLPFLHWFMLILALLLLFFIWRRFWMKKIGGFVGDCAGALIELAELVVLLVLCFLR